MTTLLNSHYCSTDLIALLRPWPTNGKLEYGNNALIDKYKIKFV